MKQIKEFVQPTAINAKPWTATAIAAGSVFFVLFFLKPFGLHQLPALWFFLVCLGFALVTAIVTAIVGLLFPLIFKQFYNHEKWTTGKNLLSNMFILLGIGVGNFLYYITVSHYAFDAGLQLLQFQLFDFVLMTGIVGIIPSTVIHFILWNNALKQYLKEAREMNLILTERLNNKIVTDIKPLDKNIQLTGNTKDEISVSPNKIIYLESSGNYVKISYLSEAVVKQKQLRTTIAQMEKDLQTFPFLVRCHRAFMVNISFIGNVEGNSLGFKLQLRNVDAEIPVSRSYTKVFREKTIAIKDSN